MSDLLIQIILAARNSDGEDTIWMQMLVLVILVVFLAIFSLSRAKANKSKEHDQDHPQDVRPQESKRPRHWQIQSIPGHSVHHKSSPSALIVGLNINERKKIKQPTFEFDAPSAAGQVKSKRKKDLHGGMELLEMSFLLRIIENANGDDEKDVIIRKLSFKELLRRGKLNKANSGVLKIYAINKGNLYSKDIQCEAMKSLAERTANSS
jgi:hypothetical protein